MPLVGSILGSTIVAELAGMTGERLGDVCLALGTAIISYIQSLALQATIVGVTGAGVAQGVLTVPPSIVGTLQAAFVSSGLVGEGSLDLAGGIGRALSSYVTTNSWATAVVPGVGAGTGTGVLLGVAPSVLSALILAELANGGIVGERSPDLANAVGNGVATGLASSSSALIVVGGPVPPFSPLTVIALGTVS